MSFKLAISAGHYLYTPGKRCEKSLDPNETREWILNDRIADKLEKILFKCDGIEVLRLDDTNGKKVVSNEERANIANKWGADFYLAIHHNAAWLEKGETFDGGGIVAYAHTNASAKSYEWQSDLYASAIKHTGLKGNRANPLAKAALYECGAPKCPAVLMECGFMNSTVDVPIILSEAYADNLAKAFAEVIVAKSGVNKSTSKGVTITLPILSQGSKGAEVKTLQRLLNALGYHDAREKPLAVDGSFGPATLYALKNFQDQRKLEVDGSCGPATWNAILK